MLEVRYKRRGRGKLGGEGEWLYTEENSWQVKECIKSSLAQELDPPTLWSRIGCNDRWSTFIGNGGFKLYKTTSVDWSWNIRLYSIKEGPTWKPNSSMIRRVSRPIGLHFKTRNFKRVWPLHESSTVHKWTSPKLLQTTWAPVFYHGTRGVNSSVELVSHVFLYHQGITFFSFITKVSPFLFVSLWYHWSILNLPLSIITRDTGLILISFGTYVKVRESLNIQVIVCVNTILNYTVGL